MISKLKFKLTMLPSAVHIYNNIISLLKRVIAQQNLISWRSQVSRLRISF